MIRNLILSILVMTAVLTSRTITSADTRGVVITEDITGSVSFELEKLENAVYRKLVSESDFMPVGSYPGTAYLEKYYFFASPHGVIPGLHYNILSSEEYDRSAIIPAPGFKKGTDGIWYETVSEPEVRKDPELPHFDMYFYGKMHGMEIYKLIFRPLIFKGNRAIFAKKSEVSIRFDEPFTETGIKTDKEPDDFFLSRVINYNIASANMRSHEKSRVPVFLDRQTEWVRLKISQEGMYRITGSYLRNAGLDISSVLCDRIRVFSSAGPDLPNLANAPSYHGAVEISRKITDSNGNGFFDPEDQIIFYAAGPVGRVPENNDYYVSKYSDHSYYWIDTGKGSETDGKNFRDISSQSNDLTEQNEFLRHIFDDSRNNLYYQNYYYAWYNRSINPGSSLDISFDIENLSLSNPVKLKVRHSEDFAINMLNRYSNNALVRYRINNGPEGSFDSSGIVVTAEIAPELFSEGTNRITLQNISPASIKYYNGFNVIYTAEIEAKDSDTYFYSESSEPGDFKFILNNSDGRKLYDITDPYNAGLMTVNNGYASVKTESSKSAYLLFSGNFKTPAGIEIVDYTSKRTLHSVNDNYDMVIIAPDEFYNFIKRDETGYLRQQEIYDNGVKSVFVANMKDISNEFGRGYQEPAATRNFIRYVHENWNAQYFLLAGDGNYYTKGQSGVNEKNLIYTSDPSFGTHVGSGSDNFYANLYSAISAQHVALGRITASNLNELRNVLTKTVSFMKNEMPGNHRTRILLVADDERNPDTGSWGETLHIRFTEERISNVIPDNYRQRKIYLTEYPFEFSATAGMPVKSKAGEDIIRSLNEGVNLFVYVGHGSPMQLAHERVFTPASLSKINNADRYFFMIGATCSFGVFNDPSAKYLMEQMLIAPNRGSIGLINSIAPVFSGSNETLTGNILQAAFSDPVNKKSIGTSFKEAMMISPKPNSNYYMLTGDPSLIFFGDKNIVESEESLDLYTLVPDSIRSQVNYSIADIDLPEKEGIMTTMIVDSEIRRAYFNTQHWSPERDSLRYWLPGNVVLSAKSSISDGQSVARFILPKDLTYGEEKGRVIFYGHDPSGAEFSGSIDRVSILGGAEIVTKDTIPPQITILFNSINYIEGDPIGTSPVVIAKISDESGINTSGSIGHKILLEINGESIDITSGFTYELDSYTQGTVSYQLVDLSPGKHTVKVSAWDTFNNYNEKTKDFEVIDDSRKTEKWIGNLLNHPNPVQNRGTDFGFTVNSPADLERYSVTVYTINGRKIASVENRMPNFGTQFQSVYWDGRDDDGDIPANGVYIYVLRAGFNDGKSVNKKGKLIFAR